MGEDTKAIIKMIKSMVMVYFNGQMEEYFSYTNNFNIRSTKEIGRMENSTEKVFMLDLQDKKRKENGRMGNVLNGLKRMGFRLIMKMETKLKCEHFRRNNRYIYNYSLIYTCLYFNYNLFVG